LANDDDDDDENDDEEEEEAEAEVVAVVDDLTGEYRYDVGCDCGGVGPGFFDEGSRRLLEESLMDLGDLIAEVSGNGVDAAAPRARGGFASFGGLGL
jgi:hypothetical protein